MIQIKDMEMPSSCYDCPFVRNERTNDYGSFCECGILENYETVNLLEHNKHPDCPLIEQEPVLDKIRSDIEETYINVTYQENKDRKATWGLRKALEIIDKYYSPERNGKE